MCMYVYLVCGATQLFGLIGSHETGDDRPICQPFKTERLITLIHLTGVNEIRATHTIA